MNPSTAGKVFIVGFIAVDSSALFLVLVIDMCRLLWFDWSASGIAAIRHRRQRQTGGSSSKISTGVSR
jgi:hypothetical protein